MTTISNLNVVVQQGDLSREAQQLKNQPLDPSQATVSEQVAKETQELTTVNTFEDAEGTKFDTQGEGKRKSTAENKKRKRKRRPTDEENPEGTGRLLDTIA